MNKDTMVNRLTPLAYNVLEQQLMKPFVAADTTAHQAGFMLGIQHVLKLLRTGYVIGA